MSDSPIEMVAAFWETIYTEEVWSILQDVKADVRLQEGERGKSELLTLAPALPDTQDRRVAQVTVHVHREGGGTHGREERMLYWSLLVRRAPTSEPPDALKALDEKLGGRPGLTRIIAESLSKAVPPIATFQATLRIERARYRCPMVPLDVERGGFHDAAARLGRGVRLEQVGYRFENGANGLEEVAIIYDHEDDVFVVKIRASGVLKLGDTTWLPYADDLAELVVGTFFIQIPGGKQE